MEWTLAVAFTCSCEKYLQGHHSSVPTKETRPMPRAQSTRSALPARSLAPQLLSGLQRVQEDRAGCNWQNQEAPSPAAQGPHIFKKRKEKLQYLKANLTSKLPIPHAARSFKVYLYRV